MIDDYKTRTNVKRNRYNAKRSSRTVVSRDVRCINGQSSIVAMSSMRQTSNQSLASFSHSHGSALVVPLLSGNLQSYRHVEIAHKIEASGIALRQGYLIDHTIFQREKETKVADTCLNFFTPYLLTFTFNSFFFFCYLR